MTDAIASYIYVLRPDGTALYANQEDIPMRVEYFAKRYAEKAGKQIRTIDMNTLELCQSYPWPGNIR
jgi:DNA-binding NtrC family response regulator